jgi:hypothetical protein
MIGKPLSKGPDANFNDYFMHNIGGIISEALRLSTSCCISYMREIIALNQIVVLNALE